jgi:serine/threonine-protein kinase
MSSPVSERSEDDKTVAVHPCPKCGHPAPLDELVRAGYRCPACNFEMAYLDVTVSGSVRGVLGWVRREGEVIQDRYRITSVLGRGGFGTTYLVQDLLLSGKRRALKEIPLPLFDEAEAALLSRLDHPSIPDIIDRAVRDGMVYLVLEFGGARTLGSERKRLGGRIPLPTLIPLAHQLCKVLSFLHAQNPPIIHRDLKPDNILLDDQDHVMLIDFGIAKFDNPDEATRTLGRAVSFGFSAPEQITGAGTNQRSDIYSLGATIYFLLTGVHPPAINAQLAGKKLEPLSKFLPEVPPALDKAVLRALELNPERRQQSVGEFAQVFEELERTVPRRTASSGAGQQNFLKRNLVALAAILLVMAVLGGAAIFLWLKEPVPEPEPTSQTTGPEAPATPDVSKDQIPAVTPPIPEVQAPPLTPPVSTTPEVERLDETPVTVPPTLEDQAPPITTPPTAKTQEPARPDETPAARPDAAPDAVAPKPEVEHTIEEVVPAPKEIPGREMLPPARERPKPVSPKSPVKPKSKSASIKPPQETPRRPAEKPKAPEPEPDWSGAMRYEGARQTTP